MEVVKIVSSTNSSALSRRLNGSVKSNWTEEIHPEINKVDGQHKNIADSHVIVDNFKHLTSILTIILIVTAILFVIHFLIQLYQAYFRDVRRSERKKTPANLPQPFSVLPTFI